MTLAVCLETDGPVGEPISSLGTAAEGRRRGWRTGEREEEAEGLTEEAGG